MSNHTNTDHPLFGCVCKSFLRPGHQNGKIAWPEWEISVKCLSQGHNVALSVQISNHRSATFRSLATEQSPPQFTGH